MILRDLISNLDKPVVSGSLDTEVMALAYDSRKIGPGAAFVALRGATVDGHQFIQTAIKAGAACVIAEQAPPEDCTTPWVHVKQSRIALARMAATLFGNPASKIALAAVTGTNGKTTIAYLVRHLMNEAQRRCGLLGTISYDLGGQEIPATHTTPESLEIQQLLSQMVDHGCRACAMEVSSHALHQHRVEGLKFTAAAFTQLTQDHLDYHGTMDAYFEAKTRLFQGIADAGSGQMVINGDDAWGRKLIAKFEGTGRVTRYGFGVHNDFRAVNVRYELNGTTFELEARGRTFLARLPLIGDFNVYNALAALGIAHGMGLNLRESVAHLQRAPQVPGRLERVTEGNRFHVYVDYAHTPDALDNVLRTLRGLRPNRIITVFGCGGDRDRTKRPRMAAAAAGGSEICVLTSDNPRSEDPQRIMQDARTGFPRGKKFVEIADRKEAIRAALEGALPGDIVLIAGKGHEDYQEVKGVRTPFDDRKVARNLINQIRAKEREREALEDDL